MTLSHEKAIKNYRNNIKKKYNKKSVFKVLDFGCSTGNLLKQIHLHYPKAEICGYDLSDSAIKLCKKNLMKNLYLR